MERYILYCYDCNREYPFIDYKTGIGKTPQQLEEMNKRQNTCERCNSHNVWCTLYWGSSISNLAMLRRENCIKFREAIVKYPDYIVEINKYATNHDWSFSHIPSISTMCKLSDEDIVGCMCCLEFSKTKLVEKIDTLIKLNRQYINRNY